MDGSACKNGQPVTSPAENSRASLESGRALEDKKLLTTHFEILASFRGHTLAILYSLTLRLSAPIAKATYSSLGSSPQLFIAGTLAHGGS